MTVPALHRAGARARQLGRLWPAERHWASVMVLAIGIGATALVARSPRPELVWAMGVGATLVLGALGGRLRRANLTAEDRALEIAGAARAAEARLRSIVEQAPDATLIVGADGVIKMASARVTTLLGYEPGSLVGRSVDDLVPIGVRQRHAVHRERFAAAPRARPMGGSIQLSAVAADGTPVPVAVSLAPIEDGQGGFDVIAALRDATVERRARDNLQAAVVRERAAASELRRADELKTAFLGTVSHELRTPLAAILGFTSLLRDAQQPGSVPAEHRDEILRRLERNARTLSRLIGELLDFSRLDRGEVELEQHRVDLTRVVEEVVGELSSIFDGHHVRFVPGPPLEVEGDPSVLGRAIANLLVNAVRHTPSGTDVELAVASVDGRVRVTIEDSGPGVPADQRSVIFERFRRGSTPGPGPGTGIGLSVVREVAERHGGRVWADESPLGGARFVIELPLAQPRLDLSVVPKPPGGGLAS